MEERLLNVTELAVLVGTSVQTINSWYRWKEAHSDHELARLIPEFRRGERRVRLWTQSDAWKLIEFRNSIPQGRNGIMGDVTQRYCKTSKHNKKNKEVQE